MFLQIPEEQNLVHNKDRQNIQTFTLVSQLSNIELHDGLDMIMRPFAIPAFCIRNRELSVIDILGSKEPPYLFLPTIRVQELKFLSNGSSVFQVPRTDSEIMQDYASSKISGFVKGIIKLKSDDNEKKSKGLLIWIDMEKIFRGM